MSGGRQLAWVDGEEEFLDVAAGLGKRCAACGLETSRQNFHVDDRTEDGRKPRCKRCVKARVPVATRRWVNQWG